MVITESPDLQIANLIPLFELMWVYSWYSLSGYVTDLKQQNYIALIQTNFKAPSGSIW